VKKLLKAVLAQTEALHEVLRTLIGVREVLTHHVAVGASERNDAALRDDLVAIEITYAEGDDDVPAVRQSGFPADPELDAAEAAAGRPRRPRYVHTPIRYSETRVVRLQNGVGMIKWQPHIHGRASFEVVRGRAVLSRVQVARNVVAFTDAPIMPGHEIAVTVETLERLAPPKGLGQ
jgi:hypothetical protein